MTTESVESTGEKQAPKPEESTQEKKTAAAETTVSREQFERVSKDMHRFKEEAKAAKLKAEELERQRLKEANDYKTLYEQERQAKEELAQKQERLTQATIYDKKHSAVVAAFKAKGLRKEAEIDVENLSLDELQIETTSTGRINVLGVDEFVERQKQLRPHWFKSGSSKVNADTPEVVSGARVTAEMVSREYIKAQKTGDYSKYNELNGRMVAERRGM